jgi:hypothetical protein
MPTKSPSAGHLKADDSSKTCSNFKFEAQFAVPLGGSAPATVNSASNSQPTGLVRCAVGLDFAMLNYR